MVSCDFGYYPVSCDISSDRFRVQTLPGLARSVAAVMDDPNVHGDWIYAGAQERRDFVSGRVSPMPWSARVFGLPKTHCLTLQSADREDLDFIVWCLSFFTGMRLTSTEAGFLDATPLKQGKLIDFVLSRSTVEDAIELGLDWLAAERGNSKAPKRVEAAIHALFLAQAPQNLPFESFQYLYMALDACYSLVAARQPRPPRVPHAARIKWLCGQFGLTVPAWADPASDGVSLSAIRNDAFHEALFFGEPLGFAIFKDEPGNGGGNVLLQMQALVCRLLVAVLGRPGAGYVATPVDSRQRYALDLAG